MIEQESYTEKEEKDLKEIEKRGGKIKYFEDMSKLIGFVRQATNSSGALGKLIHEQAHYKMAVQLGYPPKYAVVYKECEEGREIRLMGLRPIDDSITIPNEDKIKIILAPQKPDELDYEAARRLGWEGMEK